MAIQIRDISALSRMHAGSSLCKIERSTREMRVKCGVIRSLVKHAEGAMSLQERGSGSRPMWMMGAGPTEMAYCMAITFRGGHPSKDGGAEKEMENLWSVEKSSSPNYERARGGNKLE